PNFNLREAVVRRGTENCKPKSSEEKKRIYFVGMPKATEQEPEEKYMEVFVKMLHQARNYFLVHRGKQEKKDLEYFSNGKIQSISHDDILEQLSLSLAKRCRMEWSPQPRSSALDRLRAIAAEKEMPSFMKIIIEFMDETRRELTEINRRNVDILEENKKLREENSSLRLQIEKLLSLSPHPKVQGLSDSDTSSPPQGFSHTDFGVESDLKRSIVISGMTECDSRSTFECMKHD
ncbi:hypothetical protein OSTOST_08850, partial [Ostertagia ostertagi]